MRFFFLRDKILGMMQGLIGIGQLGIAIGAGYRLSQRVSAKEDAAASAVGRVTLLSMAIEAAGAAARVVDWGIEQRWLVTGLIQIISIKIIAHTAGIIYCISHAMPILDELWELEQIPDQTARAWDVLDQKELIYASRMLELFFNIVFSVHSGIQLGYVLLGVVWVTPATMSLLMIAGIVSYVGAILLKWSVSGEDYGKILQLRKACCSPIGSCV